MIGEDWCDYWKRAIKNWPASFLTVMFFKSFFSLKQDQVCFHLLPVWRWGPAPEDCWSCLWDKKPVKEKNKTQTMKKKHKHLDSWSVLFFLCACTHLLPEVQSPGDISVGVVLLIGSLMKLRLDGLRLYRKLSRVCNGQVTFCFSSSVFHVLTLRLPLAVFVPLF